MKLHVALRLAVPAVLLAGCTPMTPTPFQPVLVITEAGGGGTLVDDIRAMRVTFDDPQVPALLAQGCIVPADYSSVRPPQFTIGGDPSRGPFNAVLAATTIVPAAGGTRPCSDDWRPKEIAVSVASVPALLAHAPASIKVTMQTGREFTTALGAGDFQLSSFDQTTKIGSGEFRAALKETATGNPMMLIGSFRLQVDLR